MLYWSKSILATAVLLLSGGVQAQDADGFLLLQKTPIRFEVPAIFVPAYFSDFTVLNKFGGEAVSAPPPVSIPKIYNYRELGVFCKLDVQLDKAVKLPVRFRLGTQEIVDRKEGKY